jgi:cell division initiation protein
MIELTPLDVRGKRGDFRKGMRGYEPREVDDFLELVAERLEVVVRENMALRERTDELARRLEKAESREAAVQEALVSAQAMGEQVRRQAERDAELRLREADQEAERRAARSEQEAARARAATEQALGQAHRELDELRRHRVRFLRGWRSVIEEELDRVAAEEARTDETRVDLDELRIFRRGEGPDDAEAEPA